MKIIKWAVITMVIVVILLLILYGYYGGFRKVSFQQSEQGGEILVYEEVIGDYKQSGKIILGIYNSLRNEEKIETSKSFGIYYDNPQEVDKNKLHSEVGCILEASDSVKLTGLKNKYKIKIFPKSTYITTEFPYMGRLSILIGVMKVYPALNKYSKENRFKEKGAVMEIYDIPGKKILYRKIIEK